MYAWDQISVRSDAGLSAENTSFFDSGSQSHRENRADPRQVRRKTLPNYTLSNYTL